ncbi:SDR family oxidoreductase [uncultured Microscilla sp.]|uniref:SDR family oxidoreductase n=1 Tax=uncultured Microscilla sp. TaxID=432653 RepID=UPI002607B2A2|nr:SDR family oxidoreductase [uncultured Microscilla sp.]
MKDKVCIITGANAGIGKETTLALAKMGATIAMVCRNPHKAEEAKKEIINESGNQNIEIFICDFSIQAQIKKVAVELTQRYPAIDVLINNAGFIAAGTTRQTTPDGIEQTVAVNHLGYFMLTNLLKPSLLASPMARIINVSSDAHKFIDFNINDLQLEQGYTPMKAYSISKLLNIHFTIALAKRLANTSITVNALHPGVVRTNFSKNLSGFTKVIFALAKPFMINSAKGAATSIYLASSPKVANISGKYFANKKQKTPNKDALNETYAEKVWDISIQLTQLEGQTF